ncbi:MAG: tryptophan-rich sensory protein [Verrucomicrobia bacterium]|nr:tryptophan-rich sensory protein [Verrucomicrobiota bacterium]
MVGKMMLSIILCLGGGWLTGWLTNAETQTWYKDIIKAPGTPPNFVFPIVWTILYILMGISLGLLWSSKTENKQKAFFLFFLQLALNFGWSWIFFHFHQIGLALMDIVLLWVLIFLTIRALSPHTRLGSALLLPYFLWVTYAVYLNFFIWLLNSQ